MTGKASPNNDEFELFDLTVVVEEIQSHCTCDMSIGDKFFLKNGKVSLPNGADFCLYALQAAVPLLPAKQRKNHPADWMETFSHVVCPDPSCGLIMRVDRGSKRVLQHDKVSAIRWETVQTEG